MKKIFIALLLSTVFFTTSRSLANGELKVNNSAPLFKAKLHTGADFSLENQRGKWTVLYFFPKSETPGCTKQACAFRDNIKKITNLGAEVYGVSTDSIADQAAFHKHHALNFSLISDESGKITADYGAKMPVVKMAKRWTFILDDQLKIRKIDKEVDPITDAIKVADFISSQMAPSKSETQTIKK